MHTHDSCHATPHTLRQHVQRTASYGTQPSPPQADLSSALSPLSIQPKPTAEALSPRRTVSYALRRISYHKHSTLHHILAPTARPSHHERHAPSAPYTRANRQAESSQAQHQHTLPADRPSHHDIILHLCPTREPLDLRLKPTDSSPSHHQHIMSLSPSRRRPVNCASAGPTDSPSQDFPVRARTLICACRRCAP